MEEAQPRQRVVDLLEPIIRQSWFDPRWFDSEVERLERQGAFSSRGGLAALARYAHLTNVAERLSSRPSLELVPALTEALDAPDRLKESDETLTWLLERQLHRDPALVSQLGEARRAWGEKLIAGSALPLIEWPSPWSPEKKTRAPRGLKVEVAPFDEKVHAKVEPVPRTPASEGHEHEWHGLQFQNTYHLRWVHDEAALHIWQALDPKRVFIRLGECAPRFGLPGLSKSLELLKESPSELAAFEAFESPRLASAMSHAFAGKTQLELGRRWLERFPEAAVVGLVPLLLRRDKTQTEQARALRYLLRQSAVSFERGLARYDQAVRDEVRAILDAQMEVPSRKPVLPELARPEYLPGLVTLDGASALRGEPLGELVALLKCTPLEGAPWVDRLRSQFSEASLQRLAESLMRGWLIAGGPPKEKWALSAVAHFPSDRVVEHLSRAIPEMASSSLSSRARDFVDVLAAMNTRLSLKQVYSLSRRVRARAFRARAEQAFTAAAERAGMSPLELAERLVPDYGLTPDGVLPLSPPVRLQIVGVKASLVDDAGKVLKALPQIADEALAGELAELKKKASSLAREIAQRLEERMTGRVRMTLEHFTEVYAQHGVARQVAGQVVFGVYQGDVLVTPFVIDGAAAGLPAGAELGVLHPLELDEASRAEWRSRLGAQPFEQLARPISTFENRARFEQVIRAFENRSVASGSILGLEKRGWVRGPVEDGGCFWSTSRRFGSVELALELEPGISVGDPTVNPTQRITRVICAIEEPTSPVVLSELAYDLTKTLK